MKTTKIDLGNGVNLELVKVPAGSFLMGRTEDYFEEYEGADLSNESPVHTVHIESFWMGKYSVTQAQWRAICALPKANIDLGSTPSRFKGDSLPVEQVSWHESAEACARLSRATEYLVKLPSEAQWEYACRAGTTNAYHFREVFNTDLANYNGSYTWRDNPAGVNRRHTTVVGSFPSNSWGLHDMHGNVWEWCEDYWHDSYEGAPTDGSAQVLPGSKYGHRVMRGGSWFSNRGFCRSAHRDGMMPFERASYVGFRVVALA
jgi:formylglycine-generating enzyme required for sulfatase activity